MATKWKSTTRVRHSVHRRIFQIQGLEYAEIQALKKVLTKLQSEVDTNGEFLSKQPDGYILASFHTRRGSVSGSVHYTLPTDVLRKIRIQYVRLEDTPRRIRRNNRKDCPINAPTKRGRSSEDARKTVSKRVRKTVHGSHVTIPRSRGGLLF